MSVTVARCVTNDSSTFINYGRHPRLPSDRRAQQACTPQAPGDPLTLDNPPPAVAGAPSGVPPSPTAAAIAAADTPLGDILAALPSPVVSDMDLPTCDPAAAAAAAGGNVGPTDDPIDNLLDPGTRLLLQRQQHQAVLHKTLQDKVLKSQAKQKEDYRKRRLAVSDVPLHEEMPPGSLVLLHVKASDKLSKTAAAEGPYRLVKYMSDTRAVIEEGQGRRWIVAVEQAGPLPGEVTVAAVAAATIAECQPWPVLFAMFCHIRKT